MVAISRRSDSASKSRFVEKRRCDFLDHLVRQQAPREAPQEAKAFTFSPCDVLKAPSHQRCSSASGVRDPLIHHRPRSAVVSQRPASAGCLRQPPNIQRPLSAVRSHGRQRPASAGRVRETIGHQCFSSHEVGKDLRVENKQLRKKNKMLKAEIAQLKADIGSPQCTGEGHSSASRKNAQPPREKTLLPQYAWSTPVLDVNRAKETNAWVEQRRTLMTSFSNHLTHQRPSRPPWSGTAHDKISGSGTCGSESSIACQSGHRNCDACFIRTALGKIPPQRNHVDVPRAGDNTDVAKQLVGNNVSAGSMYLPKSPMATRQTQTCAEDWLVAHQSGATSEEEVTAVLQLLEVQEKAAFDLEKLRAKSQIRRTALDAVSPQTRADLLDALSPQCSTPHNGTKEHLQEGASLDLAFDQHDALKATLGLAGVRRSPGRMGEREGFVIQSQDGESGSVEIPNTGDFGLHQHDVLKATLGLPVAQRRSLDRMGEREDFAIEHQNREFQGIEIDDTGDFGLHQDEEQATPRGDSWLRQSMLREALAKVGLREPEEPHNGERDDIGIEKHKQKSGGVEMENIGNSSLQQHDAPKDAISSESGQTRAGNPNQEYDRAKSTRSEKQEDKDDELEDSSQRSSKHKRLRTRSSEREKLEDEGQYDDNFEEASEGSSNRGHIRPQSDVAMDNSSNCALIRKQAQESAKLDGQHRYDEDKSNSASEGNPNQEYDRAKTTRCEKLEEEMSLKTLARVAPGELEVSSHGSLRTRSSESEKLEDEGQYDDNFEEASEGNSNREHIRSKSNESAPREDEDEYDVIELDNSVKVNQELIRTQSTRLDAQDQHDEDSFDSNQENAFTNSKESERRDDEDKYGEQKDEDIYEEDEFDEASEGNSNQEGIREKSKNSEQLVEDDEHDDHEIDEVYEDVPDQACFITKPKEHERREDEDSYDEDEFDVASEGNSNHELIRAKSEDMATLEDKNERDESHEAHGDSLSHESSRKQSKQPSELEGEDDHDKVSEVSSYEVDIQTKPGKISEDKCFESKEPERDDKYSEAEEEKVICRRCPGNCGFQVTWHESHCCRMCAEHPGEHGKKCDQRPVTEVSSYEVDIQTKPGKISEDKCFESKEPERDDKYSEVCHAEYASDVESDGVSKQDAFETAESLGSESKKRNDIEHDSESYDEQF